ncbi:MAG: hypothetical protein IKN76_02870 [Oscillospiraceae bacterium]|nr:hypothetical protein [Oscillospiraceae bacterium]MBR7189669.1 hypothetical protein [Oscillospiraceae bacterium]
MIETKIYVGLNDAFTLRQEHETALYIDTLKNVCFQYHVPFSFSVQEGGYFHEDGRYTQETSLVLSLVDVAEETSREIAKDLCVFFRQESVMVTRGEVEVSFISEKI